MVRVALAFCVLILGVTTCSVPLAAQDFSVYTRVYRAPLPGAAIGTTAPETVSRSVTLFRAGKVYDQVGDEVIIFEPAHNRFVLLNTRRQMAATVHQDELRQLLKIAREETENHVARLREQQTASAAEAVQQVSFTLEPGFDESFNEAARRLKLTSRHLQYHLTCDQPDSPEIVEAYLRYADWTAKLNYVLHPHVLFPEIRLALNASLRRKKLLPLDVELHSEIGTPVHLRAEHKFRWELDSHDRSLINAWEQLLKAPTVKHVPLQEYRRTLLLSETARR